VLWPSSEIDSVVEYVGRLIAVLIAATVLVFIMFAIFHCCMLFLLLSTDSMIYSVVLSVVSAFSSILLFYFLPAIGPGHSLLTLTSIAHLEIPSQCSA